MLLRVFVSGRGLTTAEAAGQWDPDPDLDPDGPREVTEDPVPDVPDSVQKHDSSQADTFNHTDQHEICVPPLNHPVQIHTAPRRVYFSSHQSDKQVFTSASLNIKSSK